MNKRKLIEEATERLAKGATDQGRLIELGFVAFSRYVIPKDASPTQRREMMIAFMAGAQHLFGSIMGILDPGTEPTEKDLRRMDLIAREMEEWTAILSERVNPSQGSA